MVPTREVNPGLELLPVQSPKALEKVESLPSGAKAGEDGPA